MFWSCPWLSGYWSTITKTLSEALDMEIPPCPEMAIFGSPCDDQLMAKMQHHIMAFVSLLARKRILLEWKSSSPPKSSMCLSDFMGFLNLLKNEIHNKKVY